MNIELRVVLRQLGLLLFGLSALIVTVGVFALAERLTGHSQDWADVRALGMTAFLGFLAGTACFLCGRRMERIFGQREALLLVAASWIVGAALAALPFRLWAFLRNDAATTLHNFDSVINCYFEAMSGLTTTGATIVEHLATLPRSLLLWRSLTQWLGGLGIVVLFVAVLPMLGMGSRRIYRIESPGPSPEGVKPRIQDAARALWYIYCGLTVAEILALRVAGMDWFNSVCHTFATLATGGFATSDSSMIGQSAGIQVVIIAFMLFAGVNFALYHQLLRGNWKSVKRDPELRVYLGLIAVATVIISISLWRQSAATADVGFGTVVGPAIFQVVAIQTTTGFSSTDFDTWGFVAKATLLILMFIGGSAGSTGGGIKVMRIMIGFKVLIAEFEHTYRPKVVRPVKIGKMTIDQDVKRNTLVYLLGIAILFGMGTCALMYLESGADIDITTAATASAATLNNIGPGLARVGATQNYAWFAPSSKIVMCVLMLLGRLEMFTVIVLFSPRFWKAE